MIVKEYLCFYNSNLSYNYLPNSMLLASFDFYGNFLQLFTTSLIFGSVVVYIFAFIKLNICLSI